MADSVESLISISELVSTASTKKRVRIFPVEDGILNDNWHIRQSSVELLGDLLFKVAGTSGKALLEGGSDDEGASTEAHGRAIIEVLGRDKRNEVLAALYMVQASAKEAAETVVLVVDEEGVEPLISEPVKGVGDSQAAVRQSSSYLIGYLFKNSKLYLVNEAPDVISTLIILLSDPDSSTVTVAWEALSRVISSVPKEVLPSYIKLVRDAVSTSRDRERRRKKWGGPVLIPGFCLLKALQPLLPIFLQGLISGSAELREQAALGIGELIEVTSEQSLKEFVIPITGFRECSSSTKVYYRLGCRTSIKAS